MKTYYVYIMSSLSGVFYIGVTNDLRRRVSEHQKGEVQGFSQKYKCSRLVYFEETNEVLVAIEREKQLKNWSRKKKETLVESLNPQQRDLSVDW